MYSSYSSSSFIWRPAMVINDVRDSVDRRSWIIAKMDANRVPHEIGNQGRGWH